MKLGTYPVHENPPDLDMRRRVIGWEKHVPTCGNCKHHLNEKYIVGTKVRVIMICRHAGIRTFPHAVCDRWRGDNGDTLA